MKSVSGDYDFLLIDAGNTNIKFCECSSDLTLTETQHCESFEQLVSVATGKDKVVIASVRSDCAIGDFKVSLEKQSVDFLEVKTAETEFGIHCAYNKFQTLGIDRWLAILAAAKKRRGDSLVAIVDMGTATTVDILDGDRHIGGWIAPGYQLMKKALVQNTANVFADKEHSTELSFGVSTEECVNYGCLAAQEGILHSVQNYLMDLQKNYQIFLTGGGVKQINLANFENVEISSQLNFHGLKRFIYEK